MSSTSRNHRNHRNNPYVLDGLAVAFHRTAAGIAWRWRTELLILTAIGAGLWELARLITSPWAVVVVARVLSVAASLRGPGAGFGACWPATASSGCATKPGCT